MERSTSYAPPRERAADSEEYDLETQLAVAERRYAKARARSCEARDECHALEAEQAARAEVVKAARERFKAAEAKCTQLRDLIMELEERLG